MGCSAFHLTVVRLVTWPTRGNEAEYYNSMIVQTSMQFEAGLALWGRQLDSLTWQGLMNYVGGEFVGCLPCSERFFPWLLRFFAPTHLKANISFYLTGCGLICGLSNEWST